MKRMYIFLYIVKSLVALALLMCLPVSCKKQYAFTQSTVYSEEKTMEEWHEILKNNPLSLSPVNALYRESVRRRLREKENRPYIEWEASLPRPLSEEEAAFQQGLSLALYRHLENGILGTIPCYLVIKRGGTEVQTASLRFLGSGGELDANERLSKLGYGYWLRDGETAGILLPPGTYTLSVFTPVEAQHYYTSGTQEWTSNEYPFTVTEGRKEALRLYVQYAPIKSGNVETVGHWYIGDREPYPFSKFMSYSLEEGIYYRMDPVTNKTLPVTAAP